MWTASSAVPFGVITPSELVGERVSQCFIACASEVCRKRDNRRVNNLRCFESKILIENVPFIGMRAKCQSAKQS